MLPLGGLNAKTLLITFWFNVWICFEKELRTPLNLTSFSHLPLHSPAKVSVFLIKGPPHRFYTGWFTSHDEYFSACIDSLFLELGERQKVSQSMCINWECAIWKICQWIILWSWNVGNVGLIVVGAGSILGPVLCMSLKIWMECWMF